MKGDGKPVDEVTLHRKKLNAFNAIHLIDILRGDTRTELQPPVNFLQAVSLSKSMLGFTPHTYLFCLRGKTIAVAQIKLTDFLSARLGLCVKPEYRRQGIGRQVMINIIDKAKALGAKDMVADTDVDNLACAGLLEGLGFVLDSRDKKKRYYTLTNDSYTKERLCQFQRSAS